MLPDRKFSYSSGGDIQIFWLIWTSLLDLLDIVCVGAQTPVKPVINSSLVKKFNMNKITAKIPLLKIFLPRWQKYEVSKDVSVGYAVRTLERRKLEFAITKVWEWYFCISVLGLPESQKKSNQAAKQSDGKNEVCETQQLYLTLALVRVEISRDRKQETFFTVHPAITHHLNLSSVTRQTKSLPNELTAC